MQKDAARLDRLIHEILELSRDGEIADSTEKQKVFLSPFLEELISSYQKTIQDKKITVEVLGDTFATFSTKLEIFQPIIKNLLENAIQYSKENGSIEITYGTNATDFVLSVHDSGIGIDEKNQQRIFERFYRVDKARSRNSGGTGLGLSIVQNYTELLGGRVDLHSKIGRGSTFTVTIPLAAN
jgi:two-component system phosphate regulon sensor histidine kinase PhoR